MTNEHCIMKLNRIIESKKRLQADLRHKGVELKIVEQDIAALQHAVDFISNWSKISVEAFRGYIAEY